MKIATAIEKMTDFYKGNIHDIYHFRIIQILLSQQTNEAMPVNEHSGHPETL